MLCENLNVLWPIQIGLAIADVHGSHLGAWSFNLIFDTPSDSSSQTGVSPWVLGQRLADSPLLGHGSNNPCWITFGGSLDLAYLLKIVTSKPLPEEPCAFEAALADVCPNRVDLQERSAPDTLHNMLRAYGVMIALSPYSLKSPKW